MSRRTPFIVAFLVAAGLAASLLARPIQPFEASVMAALDETDATVENWSLRSLDLLTSEGQPISWAQRFRGRALYVTFWAEWCEVCKTELPSLSAFAAANQGRFDVVTVCIDSDPTAALAYLGEHFPQGTGFEVLLDPGGRSAQQFGTTGVPETFVIGPQGTVLARWVGPREFTAPVYRQLAERVAASSL